MAYAMGAPEIRALARTVRGGFLFRYGRPEDGWRGEVERFEARWARFVGVPYAVATTSGTASLMTALAAIGVGKGDEVIVPAYTFMATPLAVLAVGAVPVIAEVDEGLGMDPADAARKTTRRTRAIIPVHMMGLIANLGPLLRLARRKRLHVVEDCAQATGGKWRGRRVGAWGRAGAFSHNHYKTISAGEGGTVTLRRRDDFERAMIYQDGGAYFFDPRMRGLKADRYFAGLNFRMSELLGAQLNAQMDRLPRLLRRMNRIKRRLFRAFRGHPICPAAPVHDLAGDCGKTLVLRLETPALATRLGDALGAAGIGCATWFRSLETDRHIYQNWWPILHKRGHIDPRQDPYRTTEAGQRVRYAKDMCPKTLDFLGRSAAIQIRPNWSPSKVDWVTETVDRIARRL
jgi:8-amino-3,8-dideoxy-alpha-D-manno-octulosonate transaminase